MSPANSSRCPPATPRQSRHGTARCSNDSSSTDTSSSRAYKVTAMKRCDSTRPRSASEHSTSAADSGDTTRRLAALTGPEGLAVGVDASPRFIDAARAETRAQGIGNVRFKVDDVQTAHLGERFNLAFSQFGTMFFANPVAAAQRPSVPGAGRQARDGRLALKGRERMALPRPDDHRTIPRKTPGVRRADLWTWAFLDGGRGYHQRDPHSGRLRPHIAPAM